MSGNAPQIRVIRAIARFYNSPLLPEDTYQKTSNPFPKPPLDIQQAARTFPKFVEHQQFLIKHALNFNPPMRDLGQLNTEATQANEAITWAAAVMQTRIKGIDNDAGNIMKAIASGKIRLPETEEELLSKLLSDKKNGKKGAFASIASLFRVKAELFQNYISAMEQQNPAAVSQMIAGYVPWDKEAFLKASRKEKIVQMTNEGCGQQGFAAQCFDIFQSKYDEILGKALSEYRMR